MVKNISFIRFPCLSVTNILGQGGVLDEVIKTLKLYCPSGDTSLNRNEPNSLVSTESIILPVVSTSSTATLASGAELPSPLNRLPARLLGGAFILLILVRSGGSFEKL